MDSSKHSRGHPRHVTIVSDNPETLDGLESYLQRAGVTTSATRYLVKALDTTPQAYSVVVIFPDDFGFEAVTAALANLRSQRPAALPVLVTNDAKWRDSFPSSDAARSPLVLPKPTWGWSILDAIRGRSDVGAAESESLRPCSTRRS